MSYPKPPDAYEGVRHTVITGRTRKGRTTARVTRRGTVRPVVGSWAWSDLAPDADSAQTDPRLALAMFLARTSDDHTGLYLERAADAILGDHVPRLLGTDAVSWEQVIRHEDGRAARDRYGVTSHHVHLYDAVDVVDRRGRDVQVGRLPGANRRTLAEVSRGGAVVHATRVGDRRARVRLPYRVRKTDPTARPIGPDDVRETSPAAVAAFGGTALVAPRDARTVWIGHRVAARGGTVRQVRATRARASVGDMTLTAPAGIADVVARLNRGERATWTLGTLRGTVTRAKGDGRLSITARRDGTPVFNARGVRTVDALTRRLASVV